MSYVPMFVELDIYARRDSDGTPSFNGLRTVVAERQYKHLMEDIRLVCQKYHDAEPFNANYVDKADSDYARSSGFVVDADKYQPLSSWLAIKDKELVDGLKIHPDEVVNG